MSPYPAMVSIMHQDAQDIVLGLTGNSQPPQVHASLASRYLDLCGEYYIGLLHEPATQANRDRLLLLPG